MKKTIFAFVALAGALFLSACQDDAQIVNHNMTKAADNFEISRRVGFVNGITGDIILLIEGRCSVSPAQLRISVTCRVGPDDYIRHFFGRSDNTFYFVEQMEPSKASRFHYRRTIKPQSVIPDIDFRGSWEEVQTNHSEANQ